MSFNKHQLLAHLSKYYHWNNENHDYLTKVTIILNLLKPEENPDHGVKFLEKQIRDFKTMPTSKKI